MPKAKRPTITSPEDIKKLEWNGNHAFDRPNFEAIRNFIQSCPDPIQCRKAAQLESKLGTGCTLTDDEADEYVAMEKGVGKPPVPQTP